MGNEMKKKRFLAVVSLLCCGILVVRAGDRYVVEPGTIPAGGPGGTYESWETAATQIQ